MMGLNGDLKPECTQKNQKERKKKYTIGTTTEIGSPTPNHQKQIKEGAVIPSED